MKSNLSNLLRRTELRVSARGLSDSIIKELPVTLIILYTKRLTPETKFNETSECRESEWKEIGRTEVIAATRSPDYQTKFELETYTGHEQTLKVSWLSSYNPKFSVMHILSSNIRTSRREIVVGSLEIEAYEITQLNGR
jgi:hypothetical protein